MLPTLVSYRRLLGWLCDHGEVLAVWFEGCGVWGAGLSLGVKLRTARSWPRREPALYRLVVGSRARSEAQKRALQQFDAF